jgi:glutamate 5-kinase
LDAINKNRNERRETPREDTDYIGGVEIGRAKRLVIKIGSSLLISDGKLNIDWVESLIADIETLRSQGKEVIIVSSGAVALGRVTLELGTGSLTLEESQAAAGAGQITLSHGWQSLLAARNFKAAQILLTIDDTEQRRRYLNARNTLDTLLSLGVIPIINENDTIATQELRYGDNDRLAARVASMISADCILLLSDINGLYRHAPTKGETLKAEDHIAEVGSLTPEILSMAGDAGSPHGSGGMRTKLEAVRIARDSGCHVVLASGKPFNPISSLTKGAKSTFFRANASPLSARKNWIAGSLTPMGQVQIDSGAYQALRQDKSLLPVGVTHITGQFERGDSVLIVDPDGQEIGRGLSAYNSDDAINIMGQQSDYIADLIGFRGRIELIHRDDLVMIKEDLG